jgi:hypothetical protein
MVGSIVSVQKRIAIFAFCSPRGILHHSPAIVNHPRSARVAGSLPLTLWRPSRAAGRPQLTLVFEVVDSVSKFVIATHTNPLQRLKNKNRCVHRNFGI